MTKATIQHFGTTKVHISTIAVGDTIICNDGHVRTVCKSNIKRGGFMGDSLFGDTYKLGTQLVEKVLLRK